MHPPGHSDTLGRFPLGHWACGGRRKDDSGLPAAKARSVRHRAAAPRGREDVKKYDTAKIRNVALLGNSGSGKTSLAEAILFKTGATSRRGQTSEGTSVLDSSPEELKRKLTINMGFAPIEWQGHKVNFLDTPGFADFAGEAQAALFAADMALIVINATAGVETDTERLFELAEEMGKPACFVVNQMDKEQADFDGAVARIRELLSQKAVPFELPIGAGPDFKGVVDLVVGEAYEDAGKGESRTTDVPGDLQSALDEQRGSLAEAAAESDDALLEKYLEEGSLTGDEIEKGLRSGMHAGTVYPVLALSAESMIGLDRLMHFLTSWAPSPLEAPQPAARREGQEEPTPLDGRIDGPPVAFVFKTYSDERLGEYTVMRILSGMFSGGDYYNPRKQSSVRVGAVYALRGKERVELDQLVCGDIGATPRLRDVSTNDTLSTKDQRVMVVPIDFPEPPHTVAAAAVNRGDEEKIATGLARLQDLDPTFRVRIDSALRQTLLSGMGDQHIDVQIERLKARAKIDVQTKKPRIPFRETIQGLVDDVQGRYKKQTGGRGQYGDVHFKMEPLPRGDGFEFVDAIVGGVVPSKFIPAVEKGVRETMDRGVLVGYPVVDVKVTLHFGSYHDVDSSEMAFKQAARLAFTEGFMKCKPTLLEPIMKLDVRVPEEYTGDIMGDLSSRRGRIQGMERKGKYQFIQAEAPLAETFGYLATLRSLTQGRGRFQMEQARYEEVPREVQQKLVETLRAEQEEAKA
ncbi:MAG: elongation factor G [Candidatus Eisenbacteria bacterium]|nr:elongation factor G [Candidatus Eisenbacteria bacterium]